MIGLACVTASEKDVEALMSLVEARSERGAADRSEGRHVPGAGVTVPVSIPDHVRDTLMTGAWDTTGLLLDRYEQVNAVAAKLPYLRAS